MSNFKKHKIIMYSDGRESRIAKDIADDMNTLYYRYSNMLYKHEDYISQFLYVVSEEEIKEGDLILHKEDTVMGRIGKACHQIFFNYNDYWYKIIATTDPALNLPKLSDAFEMTYCNKGGVDEIYVEYNEYGCIGSGYCDNKANGYYCHDSCFPTIKVDINNTISVKLIEHTYSQKEVQDLLYNLLAQCKLNANEGTSEYIDYKGREWIKEKLK